MRIWHTVRYVVFVLIEVVKGSWLCTVNAFSPKLTSTPSIVEFPSGCRTDLEITAMASSITITPGTLVLGLATTEEDDSPVIFVHSLFAHSRAEVIESLTDMETRLLRALRKPGDRR